MIGYLAHPVYNSETSTHFCASSLVLRYSDCYDIHIADDGALHFTNKNNDITIDKARSVETAPAGLLIQGIRHQQRSCL